MYKELASQQYLDKYKRTHSPLPAATTQHFPVSILPFPSPSCPPVSTTLPVYGWNELQTHEELEQSNETRICGKAPLGGSAK
jgi:hypothetical protein